MHLELNSEFPRICCAKFTICFCTGFIGFIILITGSMFYAKEYGAGFIGTALGIFFNTAMYYVVNWHFIEPIRAPCTSLSVIRFWMNCFIITSLAIAIFLIIYGAIIIVHDVIGGFMIGVGCGILSNTLAYKILIEYYRVSEIVDSLDLDSITIN